MHLMQLTDQKEELVTVFFRGFEGGGAFHPPPLKMVLPPLSFS